MTDKKKQEAEIAIPVHLEVPWFDKPEHQSIRICTCFCGHRFKSRARNLPCIDKRPVKMEDSHEIVKDARGNVEMESFTVTRFLSYENCPACHPEDNWIASWV